jgi:DNA-binding transcriptional LysR family regulator
MWKPLLTIPHSGKKWWFGGLGVLPEMLIAGDIKDGHLVRVLDDYRVVDCRIELRLAYSDRKFMPAKGRAFVQYAISYCGAV